MEIGKRSYSRLAKSFSCDVCGKGFSLKKFLDSQYRIHYLSSEGNGETPIIIRLFWVLYYQGGGVFCTTLNNFWSRCAMNMELGRNVHYHNRNSWGKFQVCDVIIQVMTSSQSFRLPLTSEKVPFTKMAFKFEQSKIFQFCFDFLKAKGTIFNIIAGF